MSLRTVSVVAALLVASTASGADRELMALLGPDMKSVGGMDVTESVNSPLGQFFLSQLHGDDSKLKEFIDKTGFDPRRDVYEIVFASPSGAANSKTGIVVARGSFNWPAMLAAFKSRGANTVTIGGLEFMQVNKSRPGLVGVLDGSILLAGEESLVREALTRRGGTSGLDTRLSAKADQLSARYDVWLVSLLPAEMAGAPKTSTEQSSRRSSRHAAMLQGIQEAGGGVKLGTTVEVMGEAVARSPQDAQALSDVARFFLGMIAMQGQKSEEAARISSLLDKVVINTEGSSVTMNLAIPQAEVEELIKSTRKPESRAAAARTRRTQGAISLKN
jgi:hypothetical protein